MPLIETEGLVLKSYNLAEADKIVVILTHDHGIVRGVAKGAKRLKSRFGSSLEPFTEVRASYFQKDNIELVSLQSADLVRSNFSSASDPEFLERFVFLSDLLISLTPPHDPAQDLYRMVRACLSAVADRRVALPAVAVYFEIWLLKLAGYMPDWRRCDVCGRELSGSEEANVQANFHLLCSNCRRAASNRVLDGASREIVASAMKLSPGEFSSRGADLERLRGISMILRDIMSAAIGREVRGA